MKASRSLLISIACLVVWLVLAWFLVYWLDVRPPLSHALRGVLWLSGLVAFLGFLVLRPSQSGAAESTSVSPAGEISESFAEALNRLRAAKGLKSLRSLRTVFLLGSAGSAKTTIIAQSGLEPELLSGQAYQDNVVVPTRGVNIWFAQDTIFVDPAATLISDESARKIVFRQFVPVGVQTLLGGQAPAARSVVLSVDCESFVRQGGAELLGAKAREFQGILSELARTLGSSVPVSVLFTRADTITYFRDFSETLTESEAAEVFGVTLPIVSAGKGNYSEEETRRVSAAFRDLYYTLCDKRADLLARQRDPSKLPNMYEFPREFRKLGPLLVQFLVDVCRPNQLGSNAFLRGFYFCGVRPVTVEDLSPAATPKVAEETSSPGATRIFSSTSPGPSLVSDSRNPGSRRIPQWVFLGHFFHDIVLADTVAVATTRNNAKLGAARQVLLAVASAFAVAACVALIISYSNNRNLLNEAMAETTSIPASRLASDQLASLAGLRNLTRLRNTVASLEKYDKDGVPLRFGAFLYPGQALRVPLRTAYFNDFRKLLLAPTQDVLVARCRNPENENAQDYRSIYDALKAYLITTDHPEKSSADFLAPALLLHWRRHEKADPQLEDLARQNFRYYAAQLQSGNPYPQYSRPDQQAVDTARSYLQRFAQEERIYQAMLGAAGNGQKPIVFNVDYPGSSATVVNGYRVDGGFTKSGFDNFARQLQNPERYFSGEEWVLGNEGSEGYDKTKLVANLAARYHREFITAWQNYLKATTVVGFGSIPDGVLKLDKLSGPQSTLLASLCVASENTSVQARDIEQGFQPVHFIAPAGCAEKLVGTANQPYLQSLNSLKSSLQSISNTDPNAATAVDNLAVQADSTVSNIALNFTPDPNDPKSVVLSRTVEILRAPITRVPPILKGLAGSSVNAAAGAFCATVGPMLKKFPFAPHATIDVTLEELASFLRPEKGLLWQLYNANLKPYIVPSGDNFVGATGQQVSVTPAFLKFFNRAAHLSAAFYKDGATEPNLVFSLQPLPSEDVDHLTVTIDGQILSTDLKAGVKGHTFVWPGPGLGANLQVRFGNSPDFTIAQTSGLWALWHLVETGEQVPNNPNQMEWIPKTSAGPATIGGHTVAVKFSIDPATTQILRARYFDLSCASKAVQ